jgi:hypothetical protein
MEKYTRTYKEISGVIKEIKNSVRMEYIDNQSLVLDVFWLCANLGIKALGREFDDDEIEVVVVRDDDTDGLRIIVNTNNKPSKEQARYLLAKGLGAIVLDFVGDCVAFKKVGEGHNPISKSSDIFATALLMDEDKVKNYIHEGRGSVEELSEIFQVPLSCAVKRLMYLDK